MLILVIRKALKSHLVLTKEKFRHILLSSRQMIWIEKRLQIGALETVPVLIQSKPRESIPRDVTVNSARRDLRVFEVEQKYRVEQVSALLEQLQKHGAESSGREFHEDTYFSHPSRDFRESGEALRIRKLNGKAMVTYKGVKFPGNIKIRKELEWSLEPGDSNGGKMMELFELLNFEKVATVRKTRDVFRLPSDDLTVVVDQIDGLGEFSEIERIVHDRSQIDAATAAIYELGLKLGLKKKEARSYLGMLLELSAG